MPGEKVTICILLASYNGAKYISNQLDSLLAQTYTNWKLFIRDDGSADDTVSIINKYVANDIRISFVKDDYKNLGSCQNFARLLSYTSSKFRYFMFCDQDDFWLPFKIQDTLLQMRQLEEQNDNDVPLLVYTNFQYADNNLKVIESKKNYQSTKVSKLSFAHLLAQNPAYGCTMMLNKKLAEMAEVIPPEAENHDYWVALAASALGKIAYLRKKTVYYRQHNNNISTNYNNSSLHKRFKRIILERNNFDDVRAKIQMAVAFKAKYLNCLSERNKIILNEFTNLANDKSIGLLLKNIKNGVRRQTLSQTLLFYFSMLLLRNEKN